MLSLLDDNPTFQFPILRVVVAAAALSTILKLVYYKCDHLVMTLCYVVAILYFTSFTMYHYNLMITSQSNWLLSSYGFICSLLPLFSFVQNLFEHLSYCKHSKPLFNEPEDCKSLKFAIICWLFRSLIFFYIFKYSYDVCMSEPGKYLPISTTEYPLNAAIFCTMLFLGGEHFFSLLSLNRFISVRGLTRFRPLLWSSFLVI